MHIYTSSQIKKADQLAESLGMEGFALMENAGGGLYRSISPLLLKRDVIAVLAGRGNNGGDGVVLARYLQMNGYQVHLMFPMGEPKTKEAVQHLQYYKSCGFEVTPFNQAANYNCIIDGLLGVGVRLPLKRELKHVIEWINSQEATVISIDVPTGVDSDTGETDLQVVQADYTFSLHGFKPSCFLYPAVSHFGVTKVIDIGLPHTGRWKVWNRDDVVQTLPKRRANAHKGTFGTGLLIAGSDDMPGSAALSAIGALRFGIGKLSVLTTKEAKQIIASIVPEATFLIRDLAKQELIADIDPFSCIAIGPGLPQDDVLEQLIHEILTKEIPVILDAGALRKREYPYRKNPIILTPHPGEFVRMTGIATKQLESKRIELASKYAVEHHVIVVLKGQYTVIAFPDGSGFINVTGNESLAKGGSGDTLTGMLLASLSIHQDVKAAVANAVYIHGLCADKWIEDNGSSTLVAHEYANLLPIVMHQIEKEMNNN